MLTEQYRQAFLALQESIDRLTLSIAADGLTAGELEAAQHIFQEQILPLDLDALDPSIAAKLQSLQTEMSKQFRLLSTEIVFLKAARQSATSSQRQKQIHDRLMLLKQYCEVVLGQSAQADGQGQADG
jgi:hypothetical protein